MDFKKGIFKIINLLLNMNNINEGNKTCIFYLNVTIKAIMIKNLL